MQNNSDLLGILKASAPAVSGAAAATTTHIRSQSMTGGGGGGVRKVRRVRILSFHIQKETHGIFCLKKQKKTKFTQLGLNIRLPLLFLQISVRELIAEEEAKEAERERLDKSAARVASNMLAAANNNDDDDDKNPRAPFGVSALQQLPRTIAFDADRGVGGGAEVAIGGGLRSANDGEDDDEGDVEGTPAETNLWDKAELDRVIRQVAVR